MTIALQDFVLYAEDDINVFVHLLFLYLLLQDTLDNLYNEYRLLNEGTFHF